MRWLIILGLLSSCTFTFENGKCYILDKGKHYKYGNVNVNGYFLQYNIYGKNKNRVYAGSHFTILDRLVHNETACPAKFGKIYTRQSVRRYKEMGILDEIKRTLKISE